MARRSAEQNGATAETDRALGQLDQAFDRLLDAATPYLLELGSWIFGALLAGNLVVLAALLTVGPVDAATIIATTAFAIVLPLDIAGLVLIRIVRDLEQTGLEAVVVRTFEEAGYPEPEGAPSTADLAQRSQTRDRRALLVAYGLIVLAASLTGVAMVATLWHIAWFAGIAFAAMVPISGLVVLVAMSGGRRE
jgi:hypothetical protein